MDDLLAIDGCTLPTEARPLRLDEFDDLFRSGLTNLTVRGAAVTMRLRGDAGLRERVLDLTGREAECCSFFTFAVDGRDGEVDLTITVPPARRGVLDAVVVRAAEAAGVLPTVTAGTTAGPS